MGIEEKKRSRLSFLEDFLKRSSMQWLEKFLEREELSPSSIQFSEIKRILVIRQHDQLGDFLLATPVFRALRDNFPTANIAILVREYFSDVAQCIPYVDEVLVYRELVTRWTWKSFSSFWHQLRHRWDLAIVLNTVSHSLTSDLLAHVSGAQYIVGSEVHVFPACSRNFLYNLIAPLQPPPRHQTDRNLDIVRYIDVDTQNLSEVIHIPGAEKTFAREQLISNGLRSDGIVIGMHIGAGKKFNRWSVQHFAELAQLLHDNDDAQIVLFWGPAEYELCEQFCRYIDFRPIKVEPTNLVRLAAYFTHCHAIVCNDTGIMHLTAACGVPLVALFGATDATEWKPIGEKFLYVQSHNGKIDDIDAISVIRELQRLLGEKLKSMRVPKTLVSHEQYSGKLNKL